MASSASAHPETLDNAEEAALTDAEQAVQCEEHVWMKPEEDTPEIIAKCSRCGLLMIPKPPRTEEESEPQST